MASQQNVQLQEVLPRSGLLVSEKGQLTEVSRRKLNSVGGCCLPLQLQQRLRQSAAACCRMLTPQRMQVLCKPKILPLKSVTLEKLEEMETRMNEAAKQAAPGTAAGSFS